MRGLNGTHIKSQIFQPEMVANGQEIVRLKAHDAYLSILQCASISGHAVRIYEHVRTAFLKPFLLLFCVYCGLSAVYSVYRRFVKKTICFLDKPNQGLSNAQLLEVFWTRIRLD